MAFQVGTQIRPELGKADLSGFERSGQYLGQAIASVGAQIGEGIEKHYKKKKDADDKRASFEFLKQTGAFGNVSDEALQAGINAVGAGNIVNLYQGVLANQATKQSTEQSASLFPTQKELQEQNLLRQKQIYGQSAEAFPLQQEVTRAQLTSMTEGERRATELFPFQLESAEVKVLGQKQAINQSIADIEAQQTRLQMEQDKLDSIVTQQGIDQANAANQKRMLDAVTGGNMSNLEYIQAGGDMNALANAEKLTGGQSFATNQKMIHGIEEEFDYLRYDYETNTWTDTRGRNRSGLPWQEFPELMNFLGTRESQALSNEGFTLGKTFN